MGEKGHRRVIKICRKCVREKPLSEFERRPDARSGYRATCKDCRRDAKNATNNRYYHAHKDECLEKAAQYREQNRDRRRLADVRYHWLNREFRNAKSRAYYRANREKLILDSLARRKRRRSLDAGPTDRIQFGIWKSGQASQRIRDYVDDLLEQLPLGERAWCEQFLQDGTPMPVSVLESIRKKLISSRKD